MAGLTFDDLIPSGGQQRNSLSFDDLIPARDKPASGRHLSYEEGAALLDQEERAKGTSGAVGAGLSGYIEGAPVIGPMLMGGAQRGAAALGSLMDGESYGENLKQAQQVTKAAQEAHPYITTGANVTGAVTNMLPAIEAAPAMLGAGGGSLLTRSLASMGSGAVIGGADSGVRHDFDPTEIKSGIMWGGGTGLAGPTVGRIVGAGARGVLDYLGNTSAARAAGTTTKAVKQLYNTLAGDGLDPATAQARLAELGPEGMYADLGPGLQAQAAGLAAMPGRAQGVVRGALDARADAANSRLAAAVEDNLGPNVIPSEIDRALQQGQQRVGNLYRDAFREATPFDTGLIADDLERSIGVLRGDAQRRLQQVRQMLNIHNTNQISGNPQTLFQTRQAIDGMLTTEADPKVVGALSEVRQQLDDALRQSVPRIKEIDAAYAELSRQREALTQGQAVLDHGRTAPRPAELDAMVQGGVQPQGMQVGPSAVPLRLSQGARAEVDRILGSNVNDISALNRLIKSDGDWNRTRLATLFGQDRADRLFQVLDNERQFAQTRDIVTRNSETARRQQTIADLNGSNQDQDLFRQAYAAGGVGGTVRASGIKTADKIFNMLMGGRRQASNAELANIITSNRNELTAALSRRALNGRPTPQVEALTRAILLGASASGPR